MKKLALTLSLLFACSSFAFAADAVDVNGSLDKSKVIRTTTEGKTILADYPDDVTVQVDKNNKILSVRYKKRGFTHKNIAVGDEWDFLKARQAGHSDFDYNRDGNGFHFYTETDGTATIYETSDSRVVAVTRVAKRYYDDAKKYHNMRQLGLIK